jgi:hypothetical protein
MSSRFWVVLPYAEVVLGMVMLVASLRFLRLRRWTIWPLTGFGVLLIVGTVAFTVFWIFRCIGFFREMKEGPPLKGVESTIFGVFQVGMTFGGVVICLLFCAAFGMLVKGLYAPDVRKDVSLRGF